MDQYPQYSAASSSDVRLGRGPEVTQYQSSYAVSAPDEQLWPFGAPSILPPPALSIHAQGHGMAGPSVRPGLNHLHTWSGAQMPSINEHEPSIIGTAGPTYTAVPASRTPSTSQSGTWYDPFITTPVQPIHERKKDFICQLCKAGFPRNDSLKRHEEHGCLHRKVSKNERTQVPFESRLRSPGAASSSRNY
ncbi:hypothetical protein M8818_000892 [Zalaria obscura]|uniref:Uncharacterized protein n=1 Tax=Zalaria obscura TaxID=2024903 RepID=A0ACC3SLR9_9PEZI